MSLHPMKNSYTFLVWKEILTTPYVFVTESPMKHSKLDHTRLGQVKFGGDHRDQF